jgi:hypothetical protein
MLCSRFSFASGVTLALAEDGWRRAYVDRVGFQRREHVLFVVRESGGGGGFLGVDFRLDFRNQLVEGGVDGVSFPASV